MKKAFFITSIIDLDNLNPLTYSKTRTVFGPLERFHQTVYSLTSIDLLDKDADIFLIDASDNYSLYRSYLSFQKRLKFISVKEEFPECLETIRNYPNKSHGEAILITKFLEKYRTSLQNYDYLLKLCGRYYFDSSVDNRIFTESNRNRIFFKHPLKFEWQTNWNYQDVDLRHITGDNYIRQYCSVLYGWGIEQFDNMLDLHQKIMIKTGDPNKIQYDMESLLYFFSRELAKDITETDWTVLGCNAVGGNLMRY